MAHITEKELEMMLQTEYQKGIKYGVEMMQQKIRKAYDNGTPLEVNGRAVFLKSDIQNLRDIMEELERKK